MFINRLFVSLVAFLILMTSSFAASNNGLKDAFNEFNYNISVEWDQKDQAFYDQQVKLLGEKVKLLQAEGLTNADLVEFVIAETKNEALKKDLSLILAQLQLNKMSQSDALKLVKEKMSKNYSQGASWSGGADKIIIGLVVVLVIAWTVGYVQCINDPNHTTVCSDHYTCSTVYDSYGSYDNCYYETMCGCSH